MKDRRLTFPMMEVVVAFEAPFRWMVLGMARSESARPSQHPNACHLVWDPHGEGHRRFQKTTAGARIGEVQKPEDAAVAAVGDDAEKRTD